jgi:proteasome lid subunit RPN8/RPN11
MTEKKTYPLQSASKGPRRAKMPLARAQRWLAEGEAAAMPELPVFVTQTVYETINKHANTDLDNEVGGWLAGRWCKDVDSGRQFVVVEALLPAQQVRSGSTFLTFTHDSQVAMLAALEERYAKKGVVGWYHTHPRMGIFLSGYDTWLHNHFFPHPWQVALVVEPHSKQGGFFVRKDGELSPRNYGGFYELRNRRVETVVDWKNVHLEKIELAGEETEPLTAVQPKKQEPVKVEVKPSEKTAPAQKTIEVKTNGSASEGPKKEINVSQEAKQ